ncbi:Arylsulfatase [Pseudoruegeria aquimaris]|uniref:Arylsulfatase n=1 Tax=Pseudoruegeria aquimaris TaxID=393663 RepID=A0A1Y5RU64_9RHOB|nr:sulfatase-like hydrolase/transferase [Pseudoruegeria aquimaris]SLN25205.1 Arylsulfatase [Pseudoruegeria aquimaris]
MARNVLFIMCDQLRFDYLGCAGHPTLRTPNIDALARRGVRFTNCYVQSPICGPSRMSTYTGRYVKSHGARFNQCPLRVGEWTLGDHLNQIGARAVLCGKTHMRADIAGMERLGIDPDSPKGRHIAEGGFEVWDRLDGLHPDGGKAPSHYNDYLRAQGFTAENPWQAFAASAETQDGMRLSGWLNENAHRPARIPEAHSETAYSTNRAMEFIAQAGETPWCLHLSYIKPHWPLLAPAPYHAMYGPEDVIPVVRSEAERQDAHPFHAAHRANHYSRIYSRPGARERMIATYMGLITQIDDHIGRLMAFLEASGQLQDTLIIFTSDHGDYLGDHWMGEKSFFHDVSAKVPLIVVDPSPEADGTRGTEDARLTEAIDLAPTIVEAMGGVPAAHILEGRSLLPLLRGEDPPWRGHVISEIDFSVEPTRRHAGRDVDHCTMTMIFDGRFKYCYAEGVRPILFDLVEDPFELRDLGADPSHAETRARLHGALAEWALARHPRTTMSRAEVEADPDATESGILIGFWDESEVQAELEALARHRAQAGQTTRKP